MLYCNQAEGDKIGNIAAAAIRAVQPDGEPINSHLYGVEIHHDCVQVQTNSILNQSQVCAAIVRAGYDSQPVEKTPHAIGYRIAVTFPEPEPEVEVVTCECGSVIGIRDRASQTENREDTAK